jgi:simple sugar transport system permease protein
MNDVLNIAFFLQTIRITIPYLLPSLGATFSEKGGVINIALEGMLLMSAFCTTVGTYYTHSILVGILSAVISGILIGVIHGYITITLKANQIVSGIAINILVLGTTKYFCNIIFNSSSNSERIIGLETLNLPFNPYIIICIIIPVLSYFSIYKTKFGLRLTAAGENPDAADSLGVNVNKIRYTGVLISGVLSGLGGAWLAFDQHNFTDGMSAGRGYIALAAMIIGKWNPFGAASACLLFGFAESFTLQFQGSAIPTQFIQMLPYVLTIIVLAGFVGKAAPPSSNGIPFEKKE